MRIEPVPPLSIDPIPIQHIGSANKSCANDPSSSYKRVIKVLVFSVILLVFLSRDFIADTFSVLAYTGDSDVVALADKSGMNMNGKALFLSASPELVDANKLHEHCPMEDENSVEYGCYIPSKNKIYILKLTEQPYSEIAISTAAHEMLHVAWSKLGDNRRREVLGMLNSHMSESNDYTTQSVKASLELYDKAENIQSDELHALIGSEVDSKFTVKDIEDYYRIYFSNRSKTVASKINYDQGVEKIETDISTKREAINKLEVELSEFADKWLHPIEAYMQQNAYYGDYYTYNKNVDAYNNNLSIYNSRREEYERLITVINVDIEKYNNSMSLLVPSKQQGTLTEQDTR